MLPELLPPPRVNIACVAAMAVMAYVVAEMVDKL